MNTKFFCLSIVVLVIFSCGPTPANPPYPNGLITPSTFPTLVSLPTSTQVLPTPTPFPTESLQPIASATMTREFIPNSQSPIVNTDVSQAATANYFASQKNPDLTDEEKIKIAIDAYFTIRYEVRKSIAEQDFSFLLEDDNLAWVKTEKDKLQIEMYIACMFDTGYKSYKFDLGYTSLEIKKDKALAILLESNAVVFNAIAPEISQSSGIAHQITLHNKNGSWVIYEDKYKDDNSSMFVSRTKEEVKNQVDKNYASQGNNPNVSASDAAKCQTIIH